MSFTPPANYYDRFDRTKNFDKHLFRAGYVMQSAEFNEVQSAAQDRLQRIADAILKDGDIISGADIIVDAGTGACTCQVGAVYLRGAVRTVPAATLTLATTGAVQVGAYLVESVITELEDASLRDPAIGMRNYQEPGAARLQVAATWGYAGSGQAGEFYPIWAVVDGVVLPRTTPPQIDAVSNAIATYDRQSTGGTYIVSGLRTTKLDDLVTGDQVYSVSSGEARIGGRSVALGTARRVVYTPEPDLRRITSEPKVSSGTSAQRVTFDRTPMAEIISVSITAEKTVTVTHGGYTGAMDSLPDASVLSLVEVKQGGTTYVANTDYRLTSGKVDWSLTGSEPAPGSSYTVKYQYITTTTPTAVDELGFTVTGAVASSLIQTSYDMKLPRIDRLCLTTGGELTWVRGISADESPVAPSIPSDLLLLASVSQTWFAATRGTTRTIKLDGGKVVPMSEIEDIKSSVMDLYDLVAQQRLQVDINGRLAAATKGVFVDNFLSTAQRDSGATQTAITYGGLLMMPVSESVTNCATPSNAVVTLAHTNVASVSQSLRTTTMKVNPYQAFNPIPAKVTLAPAVDNAVQTTDTWAPDVFIGSGNMFAITGTTQIGQTVIETFNLRQIQVNFSISGFGSGEQLTQVKFDGVDVTASVGA